MDKNQILKDAIKTLQDGKEKFKSATNLEQRESGYNMIKIGAQQLTNLYKETSDETQRKALKVKLEEIVEDLKAKKEILTKERVEEAKRAAAGIKAVASELKPVIKHTPPPEKPAEKTPTPLSPEEHMKKLKEDFLKPQKDDKPKTSGEPGRYHNLQEPAAAGGVRRPSAERKLEVKKGGIQGASPNRLGVEKLKSAKKESPIPPTKASPNATPKSPRKEAAEEEKLNPLKIEAAAKQVAPKPPAPKKDPVAPRPPTKEHRPSSDHRSSDKPKSENDPLKQNIEGAIVTEKPNVKWDDIAGLTNAKKSLQEAVVLPIKFPKLFDGNRTPWKGILLYGPPGTGKTFLAKACATEADGTFFSISSSDIMSKYVGESERLIKSLFEMAREKKPAIIFIDEVDSLCGNRTDGENEAARRVKTEFLVQMQGVGKDDQGVLVLGATNIPWGLDPGIRRRFEKRIYIPLPDTEARLYLLKMLMKRNSNCLIDSDYEVLAKKTEGFSGADLSILVKDACMEPLRRCQHATAFKPVTNTNGKKVYEPCEPNDPQAVKMNMMEMTQDSLRLPDISLGDFEKVLPKVKPSVGVADIKRHEEFTTEFGMEG